MEYADYVRQGLEGEEQLKLILCGSIQDMGSGRAGVVSVVYATKNRDLAEQKIRTLAAANPEHYYMVYSVPLDTDLTELPHYPSIAVTPKEKGKQQPYPTMRHQCNDHRGMITTWARME